MLYGLKLVAENQLLTGDGTGSNLSGLITNSTAYSRGTASGDTDIDVIRKAKTQVRDSNFEADGVIVNPHDWERMELTKTTYGEYIVSVPKDGAPPRLWSMNVVATPAIPVGKFLVGAFKMAAAIWDRNDAAGKKPDAFAFSRSADGKEPINDFRNDWGFLCAAAGLGKMMCEREKCRDEDGERVALDADGNCVGCGKKITTPEICGIAHS